MFEVICSDGEKFVFDSFKEIEEFFNEVVWAEGAEDAKITIRLADNET